MVEPIAHLYKTVALHKALRRYGRLPTNAVNGLARRVKHLRNPQQATIRTEAAMGLGQNSDDLARLKDSGVLPFVAAEPVRLNAALAAALDCFARHRAAESLAEARGGANKGYLVTLLRDAACLDESEIFRFVVSRPLVDLATAYFGAVPLLSAVRLWWTPPNDSLTGSQRFHLDEEDDRQLKLFIHVLPCTEASGPLTVIPAQETARLRRAVGHRRGRLEDKEVADASLEIEPFVLTGDAGSGAWVDTSRCLHYGSRGNSQDRLVLMCQFTHHLAPKIDAALWYPDVEPWAADLDPIQRLVLGVR